MKPYILCCGTNGRAVIYAMCEAEPVVGEPIRTGAARMVLASAQGDPDEALFATVMRVWEFF